MRGTDLLRQVKLIAPAFAGARVAFVGDSDGMSLLLGLLSVRGGPRPAALHLLDFDERLLDAALGLAARQGLGDLLHAWRYNVFDPVPDALAGHCDWFYTNPPYGKSNNGGSARHRYRLDDDPNLVSDLVIVDRVRSATAPALPYAGRRVVFAETPHFYGRGTPAPYPRYIAADGTRDDDWTASEEQEYERRRPAPARVA